MRRLWTPDEDAIIRATWPKRGGPAKVRKLLPHRTPAALRCHAKLLGVVTQPKWTTREVLILREEWLSGTSTRGLREKLRGRPWCGIVMKARSLGLRLGAPQGHETLTACSKRLGFGCTTQFQRVLTWAGVQTTNTRALNPGREYRVKFVDSEEAEAALRRWMEAEDIGSAARRRGLYPVTLRRWCRADGVLEGSQPEHRYRQRLPSSVIDRVVAQHRPAQPERRAA